MGMRTERADINQVLEQMRAMRSQAQSPMQGAALKGQLAGLDRIGTALTGDAAGATQGVNFSHLFQSAISQVNQTQQSANALADAYETGAPGVDITQVMVASQKAAVSFQAAVQVRNKLVSAYQDIMNMPI